MTSSVCRGHLSRPSQLRDNNDPAYLNPTLFWHIANKKVNIKNFRHFSLR